VVQLCIADERVQAEPGNPPFHEWIFPDGTRWTQFHRSRDGFLLRFPELADYQLSADSLRVTCHPVPGVAEETLRELYLNQVLPLALSQLGRLVLHASSVEVGDGAVVFLGESGRGKSTLAAAFATSGYRFLTDDGLSLHEEDGACWVQPSHPSIRLWADSERALVPTAAAEGSAACAPKVRFLAGDRVRFCSEPRPLRRVYALGAGACQGVVIEKLSPRDAVTELIRNSFLLDVEAPDTVARHFERMVDLAKRPIYYRLDYPRRFEALASVRSEIIRHCQG
jgi:hypothetical protein